MNQVIQALSTNAWTAVIVDGTGTITALVATDDWPSPEFVMSLNRDYPNTVGKLLPRGDYSPESVEAVLKSIRETFELRDQGLLGSGITTV